MFALVRIHVPSTVYDPQERVTTTVNPNYIWDHVAKNYKKWHTDDVRLLYMTHRHLQEDTTLIVDTKDSDALADFLMRHIAPLKFVRGMWILNMAKLRFFKLPQERPREFSRFTVTIDVIPQDIDKVYETISAFKPGKDIIVNYIVYTFQSFSAAIMASVLATNKNSMEAFVEDYIKPLKGVADAKITRISKTMRLVSPEEWQASIGRYVMEPGGTPIKSADVHDDSLVGSC